MAVCTQYSGFIVQDTPYTIQYGLNGIYTAQGTNVVSGETYTVFIKENAVTFPQIQVSEGYGWQLKGSIPYPGISLATMPDQPVGSGILRTSCPVPGEWSLDNVTITGILATPSEPTFGLPADVVAQMVAAHGSVANFLRLRNQGQI